MDPVPTVPMILSVLLILTTWLQEGTAIVCHVCHAKRGNICQPYELWGNRTECPNGVTTCYKSWSVEADPKTRRKCGSRLDVPDEGSCAEALEGANKIMLCKCGEDLCNGARTTKASWEKILVMITSSALIMGISSGQL
eukprot:maker-scaffold20_size707684-snap-gene-6.16 protein:Tk03860 transcript:maker-scaffold20_size707684-snap-gene-6.16-mRNA-1 annotation:"PREDICTED: uncharacterized protein LOC103578685"